MNSFLEIVLVSKFPIFILTSSFTTSYLIVISSTELNLYKPSLSTISPTEKISPDYDNTSRILSLLILHVNLLLEFVQLSKRIDLILLVYKYRGLLSYE